MDFQREANTAREQYRTSGNLDTRISVHDRYSTNRQGFGNWITSQYAYPAGASVLELGCGTGGMWQGKEDLIRRCGRLILTDFSGGMLDKARETLRGFSGIEFRCADIQRIPYPDHSFDAVMAHMMLYHVPDLEQGLREVRRVLKEDGVFYCATYGEGGIMAWICETFGDCGITDRTNHRFTLQNGEAQLRPFFGKVRRTRYEDSLAVTRAEDMADYIFSLEGLADLRNLPRSTVIERLESRIEDGVLRIPKEYGMFIAEGVRRAE